MRIAQMSGFGVVTPDSWLTPGPQPQPFRGFGGEWEDWCDANYYSDQWNAKCKNCPQEILGKCISGAPYTTLGKATRGLPSQTDKERGVPRPGAPDDEVVIIPDTGGPSWFDQNKTTVLAVGGIALVGLLAFAMKRRRGRMNGLAGLLGFAKSRRRKRRN